MKKTKGKVIGGALAGAALGVAGGMLLESESGKKVREDIKKLSGDFYSHIAPKVKKLKKVSEEQYHDLMVEGAKNYTKAKKLSLAEQEMLTAHAKRSWKHLKKHLG